MKKNAIYALMSAIALTGAVSFSSCSSDDEVINNPNYDPETNMVKTQFAISLGDNVVKTRMSSGNTQAEGTTAQFRGLQDILLIPFKSTSPSDANFNGKVIGLTEDGAANRVELANDKNYLYNNVDVRTLTDYFVFYAVAKPGNGTGFSVGRLVPTLPLADATSVTMESYGFALAPIINSTEYSSKQTEATAVRDNLIAKLNQVLAVNDWKTSTIPALTQLYTSFKSLRVGSSEGVQRALQNLYSGAQTVIDTYDGDAETMATAIQTAITAALTSPQGSASTDITVSAGVLTFGAGYNNYPSVIGLPNGSARLAFTDGGDNPDTFGPTNTEILLSAANTTAPDKFAYPADLRYFQKTPIKTATTEFLNTNLSSSWATITGNDIYSGTSVTGETRSIVLVQPVQYGVGRLETSIAAMDQATYYDRTGNAVQIPSGGFTLTGVIVGNQKQVDWQFVPTTGDVYSIYDHDVSGVKASSAASTANHTLVLETPEDTEVRVALQFENNSNTAFTGADGIIYPGHTFYMVANLNPKLTGGNGTQPTGGNINQVFLKDYVTKAIFTIAAGDPSTTEGFVSNTTGFGAALSGLPDLTTATMEFGLSVNLQWQAGLTFNIGI